MSKNLVKQLVLKSSENLWENVAIKIGGASIMVVWHGSNSNFKQLKISRSLVKHDSTMNNEGLGIYFSTDKNVAESYGKYVYKLYVNDKYLKDFRQKTTCLQYVSSIRTFIRRNIAIDLLCYIDLNNVAQYMYNGGMSIYNLSNEIINCLESVEQWYKIPAYKQNKVYSLLRQWDKNNAIVYMFNYHIKNIGVIKKISDDIVIIDSKYIVE